MKIENKVSAIVLAGGSGLRMKNNIPKQFLLLGGKPIIVHVIEKLEKIDNISEIIVVCQNNYFKEIDEYKISYGFKKIIVISGGRTRQESVFYGLQKVTNKIVIIHESVRPFVKEEDFVKMIEHESSNVTYAIRVPFTVLEGSGEITGILDRDDLLNIQLPQKFDKELLLKAHKKAIKEGKNYTEDGSMIHDIMNQKVTVLPGNEYNFKITYNIDLLLAEVVYKHYIIGNER